ncbi:MAG: phage tail tape measure protein [Marinifilaceae bacterium]
MAKNIVSEDLVANIIVKGDDAKNELFQLESAMKDLNGTVNSLNSEIKKYDTLIEKNTVQMGKNSERLEKMMTKEKEYINIANSRAESYREIKKAYENLTSQERQTVHGFKMKDDMLKAEASLNRSIKIYEKTIETQDKLKKTNIKLSQSIGQMTEKRAELNRQVQAHNQQLSEASEKSNLLRKKMDINTLTIAELNKEISRTNDLFRNTDPNTPAWHQHQRNLEQLKRRHNELTVSTVKSQSAISRMADGMNKYSNIVMTTVASLAGLAFTGKQAINKYVEFTDKISDVQKTTRLAEETVLELNERLKQVNTRSSQEELLGLARIAGKLGIEGVDNIEGFVESADKINVALKEDLGGDTEAAINQVGKLVDIFKVQEQFGIETGLLKVGSVINELGASSTANEGYIVEFSKRVAGVAPSAGVSISAVMGLAATLDKLGQTSEVSSTVYSQLVTGMFKKTSEYARIAGMDVNAFSTLVKEDANEAMIKVLEGMKGDNAEMEQLVANMGDIGVNGDRAVAVIGTLASNTEILRAQQALANEAFDEGVSLNEEFAIKNENLAGKVEKVKKQFQEKVLILGKQLQPAYIGCTSAMSLSVTVLMRLITFLGKYGTSILYIVGVIGTYIALIKVQNALQSAWILKTEILAAAKMKLSAAIAMVNKAMAVNPWVAAITAVAALGVGIYKLCTQLGDFEKMQLRVNKANTEANRAYLEEQETIDTLFGRLNGAKKGTEEYQKAKDTILSKYGQYLKGLDDEKKSLEDIAGAYDAITTAAKQSAMERAKTNALTTAEDTHVKSKVDNLIKIKELLDSKFPRMKSEEYFTRIKADLNSGILSKETEDIVKLFNSISISGGMYARITTTVNPLTVFINQIQGARKTLEKEKEMIDSVFSSGTTTSTTTTTSSSTGGSSDDPNTSPVVASRNFNEEIVLLKEQYARRLVTEEEYLGKLEVLQLAHLKQQLAEETKDGEKKLKLREQIAEKEIAIQKRFQDALKTIKQADTGFIDKFLAKAEVDLADDSENEKTVMDNADADNKQKKRVRRRLGLEENEDEESMRFSLVGSEDSLQGELDLLASYYERGFINHEEYERQKSEVTKKYSRDRLKMTQSALQSMNQALSAATNFFEAQKNKELEAAGDNEVEKELIRKRYAEKEKKMAIAQAMIAGSMAIMNIWSATATGNLIADTILKTAATVAQTAMTASQIAVISSQQFAKGRYPVRGADDGQLYNAEMVSSLQTGIYDKPSLGLFSEKKPEMVIDGETTNRMVLRYPELYRSILDISKGRDPGRTAQYAQGRYVGVDGASGADPELTSLIRSLGPVLTSLQKGIPAHVSYFGRGGIDEMNRKVAKFNSRNFK